LGQRLEPQSSWQEMNVHEIGGHVLGVRLEFSFTVVTLQLVNNTGHQVFSPCALATSSTRKGKQGGRLHNNSRSNTLLVGRSDWSNTQGGLLHNNIRSNTQLGDKSDGSNNLIFCSSHACNICGRRSSEYQPLNEPKVFSCMSRNSNLHLFNIISQISMLEP
jgi:hypothetical protein